MKLLNYKKKRNVKKKVKKNTIKNIFLMMKLLHKL